MNFADAAEIDRQVREAGKTHFVVKIVTQKGYEYRQMSRAQPDKLIFGFLPASMMHGATVYAAGVLNPLTQGLAVYPHPSLYFSTQQPKELPHGRNPRTSRREHQQGERSKG